MPSAIVYGGRGALGAAVVGWFKQQAWRVISIDLVTNPNADGSVVVSAADQGLPEQGARVAQDVEALLDGSKVDAVLCLAGGWQGGNAASSGFLGSADQSIKQSVNTSLIAAAIAARHMSPGGLLVLTGAVPALEGGTPGMIGYGMAKAAVHHLVASLALPGSGLDGSRVAGLLPQILDTPANRNAMPSADFSAWTPLATVAETLFKWASCPGACESGRLYKVVTKDSVTTIE
ncbi:hypothetical protein LPJ61_002451 [Coemansia biformis]|uniref:Dihydropteridine reductase n=1 Tax=Coemansia biformis TaxID=1286918 RepID=A0A9W8CZM8_9FUNG|nr:hypothetical protein LPJ61_002451 [Coemansia biformis]